MSRGSETADNPGCRLNMETAPNRLLFRIETEAGFPFHADSEGLCFLQVVPFIRSQLVCFSRLSEPRRAELLPNLIGELVNNMAVHHYPDGLMVAEAMLADSQIRMRFVNTYQACDPLKEDCKSEPLLRQGGFGLIIIRELARDLGAKVWFRTRESRDGLRRVTFNVAIPQQVSQ